MNYRYKRGQLFGKKLKVPSYILSRIRSHTLTFQEFMEYELEGKVPYDDCLREEDLKIVKKFGLEKCKQLDWELIDSHVYYADIIIKNELLTIDPDVDDINLALYDLLKDAINPEDFSLGMREVYKDRYMETPPEATPYESDLVFRYNTGRLYLNDILENWDFFKGKNFTYTLLKDYHNKVHLTDTVLRDFVSNYPSLVSLVTERGDAYTFISELSSLEEEKRFEYIKQFTDGLLKSAREEGRNYIHFRSPYELTNDECREIFKYSSLEEFLKSVDEYRYEGLIEELNTLPQDYLYSIPFPIMILSNRDVLDFVNEFGLKNIVDFDNECGHFFSNNDFEVLKLMSPLYLHYSSGYDSDKSFYVKNFREGDQSGTYTKEEFYEAIRRMIIVGPTDGTMRDKAPNYRNITGEFRTKNPNLFIDEQAPMGLQDLFYTKLLTPSVIASHPEYIEYLSGKDLSSCFKNREIQVGSSYSYGSYHNMYKYLEEKFGFDETMSFISEYSDILDVVYDWSISSIYRLDITYQEDDDLDKMKERIDEEYIKAFSKGDFNFPKRIPERLKTSYPKYFLRDDVDEKIREKFYNRELTILDFENNPEWIDAFDETNIIFGFPKEMSWMISLFEDNNNMKIANLNRIKVIVAYSKIQDVSLQAAFKEYVIDSGDAINLEKLEYVSDVLTRLSLSNSSEIFAFRKALATQILNSDNPIETLDKIEDLFIRNNIPTIGKIYSCFEILHPDFVGFNFTESSMVSPVLKRSSTTTKKIVVFSDLIKATLGSNNRSVNAYIKNIEYGSMMYEKIKNHEIEFDLLSEADKSELLTFSKHLITMYNTSLMAKRANQYYESTGDVIKDILEVAKLISPNNSLDYNIGDRIIRMFCGFSGIDTVEQAKGYVRMKVRHADTRNREAATRDMVIQEGDFIKGIGDVTYLRNILQNGSVSKEFLGSSAGSDLTPLDTDLSMVLDASGGTSETIDRVEAKGYGPIWFVLKRDNRFQLTRTSDGDLDSKRNLSKLEVFYTGAVGKGHYGIRTGFASSEIDYIVMEKYDARVGLEIAMNGFYIPIANKQGKIIFTPKDYDELRAKMSGLSYYGEEEYHFSDSIYTPEVLEIASQIEQSNIEVKQKRTMINNIIRKSLEEVGLHLKTTIDGDLTPGYVELIDTGSTGRGTNKPGDGDFDFMMRLDRIILSNPSKLGKLKQALLKNLGKSSSGEITGSGDFRLKDVEIGPNTIVDIDITFTEKTDKVTYSTDMSLQDRLSTIERNDPEKYKYVVANILLAKQVLKTAGVYKPNRGEVPQGGLGGVGIENWILQNGGSFIDAARSFLDASEGKTFQEFQQVYRIWDFGENHLAERRGHYSHDNFVTGNMSEEGYKKMCEALRNYLNMAYQEQSIK